MNNFGPHSPKRRKGEHIGNIIANIIGIWILSMVPGWELDFLAPNYMVVLTVMQINCIVQIAGSAILLLTQPRPVMNIIKIIMEAAGLVVLVLLYYLYPFTFSNFHNLWWLDRILPILFVIAMVVSLIKIINFTFRLVVGNSERPV